MVERLNRLVQQLERAMIDEKNMPKTFWAKFVHTTNYFEIKLTSC